MADFKTHISVSTIAGIGYGAAGLAYGFEPSACMVAAGLCSVSGMLPDLDSDTGRPAREMITFTAAVIPALMLPRFFQMGMNAEHIAMAAGIIYVVIRFGVGKLLRRYTVHRGMWHSIPAAAIAGLATFLVVSGTVLDVRLFKTIAVVLGFLIHLVLDEFWSVEVHRGKVRIKKSFGTALKFWGTRSLWANFSVYGKLAALVALVIGDPFLMDQMGFDHSPLGERVTPWLQQTAESGRSLLPGDGQSQGILPGLLPTDGPLPVEGPAAETANRWLESSRDRFLPGRREVDAGGWAPAPSTLPPSTLPPPAPEPPQAETARRPFYYPAR